MLYMKECERERKQKKIRYIKALIKWVIILGAVIYGIK